MVFYDEEEERYVLDVPTECPKCGSELEPDFDYDETHFICTNPECDYSLDVTEDFKQLERLEEDNDGDDEDEDDDDDDDE